MYEKADSNIKVDLKKAVRMKAHLLKLGDFAATSSFWKNACSSG